MALMALDVGERRVGIAISDSGILASPHSVLHRKSKKKDFARLRQLIESLNIEHIIVGMPYSLSSPDPMGPQAKRVKRYAEAFAQTVDIPVDYFDESYSTVEAESYLAFTGQKKVPIDAAAAAVILQNYLNHKKNEHI